MTLADPVRLGEAALHQQQAAYARLFDFLAITDDIAPSDAIVCFGSKDPVVPARAAALYAAGMAPVIVTTGAHLLDGGRSEADTFAAALVRLGVPAGSVIVEQHSRHTGDNVILAMSLLRQHLGTVDSVIAVAWPFAARRCRATFAHHAPEVRVRSVPSFDEPGVRTPLTPTTARWAVEQFDRLRRYSTTGVTAPVVVPDSVLAAAEAVRRALTLASR